MSMQFELRNILIEIGFALHRGQSECPLLLLCIRVDILWTSNRVAAKAAKLNMKKVYL